ncbi:MAG: transmembrane sensor [Cyclobacteriaceae bacterium]|jgi:transmembrane sensor
MTTSDNIDSLLNDWLEGRISDADFSSSVSAEEFRKYQQIVQEVDSWTPSNNGFTPNYIEIVATKKEAKVVSFGFKQVMLIAASVSLLIIASVFYIKSSFLDTHIYANAGEVREILLPDGVSKVFLSGNTEISWNSKNWSDLSRTVHLSGKAYFEVVKGSPFTVLLNQGNVQVLGTRFEIDEFYENMAITCFEGKVRAMIADKSVDVIGGQTFMYTDQNWIEQPYQNVSEPDWLQDKHSFKEAPLLQVFKALESTYNITIQYGDLDLKRKFTGTFPKDDLNLSLRIIFDPLEIKYRLDGDELFLLD